MKTPSWVESDIAYVRSLGEAGVNGVTSIWKAPGRRASAPVLSKSVWVTVAICGVIGGVSALLGARRTSRHRAILGGLVGGAIGFTGGVAWASRDLTGAVARSVGRNVNAVRDARWLEKHPINYA
jgi:hypothetical protein